jgi:hypothetical protein
VSRRSAKAFREALGIAAVAASADLRAARYRIPRCIRPLDCCGSSHPAPPSAPTWSLPPSHKLWRFARLKCTHTSVTHGLLLGRRRSTRGARFRPRRRTCRGPVRATEAARESLHPSQRILIQFLRSQRLPRQPGWCRPCFVPTGLSPTARCRTMSRARDRPRQCRRSGKSGCAHPGA